MDNRKPIKRDPAMVEFSKDHHFALLLIWKIRQGIRKSIEPDRISRYIVHFFDHELNMHFEEEENLLFIHLPESNSLRARAEKEHISIRQEIKQLRIKGIDHDQLEKLAEKLEDHIRFEERKLYNYLQQTIPEKDMANIAASLSTRKHDADRGWNDNFWDTKS